MPAGAGTGVALGGPGGSGGIGGVVVRTSQFPRIRKGIELSVRSGAMRALAFPPVKLFSTPAKPANREFDPSITSSYTPTAESKKEEMSVVPIRARSVIANGMFAVLDPRINPASAKNEEISAAIAWRKPSKSPKGPNSAATSLKLRLIDSVRSSQSRLLTSSTVI